MCGCIVKASEGREFLVLDRVGEGMSGTGSALHHYPLAFVLRGIAKTPVAERGRPRFMDMSSGPFPLAHSFRMPALGQRLQSLLASCPVAVHGRATALVLPMLQSPTPRCCRWRRFGQTNVTDDKVPSEDPVLVRDWAAALEQKVGHCGAPPAEAIRGNNHRFRRANVRRQKEAPAGWRQQLGQVLWRCHVSWMTCREAT